MFLINASLLCPQLVVFWERALWCGWTLFQSHQSASRYPSPSAGPLCSLWEVLKVDSLAKHDMSVAFEDWVVINLREITAHIQLCAWAVFLELLWCFFPVGRIWFQNHTVVCFPKTLDICRTSVILGIDAQAWVAHAHKALTHILSPFHCHRDWPEYFFWSCSSSLLLCCCFIFYQHTVTGQIPSAQRATESESKNFIWNKCIKRKTAKLPFLSIIDICLQAMHYAWTCSYDNHVLNIMFRGSGGLVKQALTSLVHWLWQRVIAYKRCVKSVLKAGREWEKASDNERQCEREIDSDETGMWGRAC